jgi:hypothetical protein
MEATAAAAAAVVVVVVFVVVVFVACITLFPSLHSHVQWLL